ncbi:MAG: MSMEG_1061 family FMN-dependent PPOX-type flavoprotein [Pseudomonadota bacterium]
MKTIGSVEELTELYPAAAARSLTKVTPHISPLYRRWIEASRFVVLATVGPEGCDASPRGDTENLVKLPDSRTIWLPDWRGNNRLDSLTNIVRDPRVSLMFMVHGSNNVVRVIGDAVLTADPEVTREFRHSDKLPRTVVVVSVKEVYFQCAKALMRSDLWNSSSAAAGLPTAGDFLREQEAGFDAESYDAGYDEYARERMW